MARYEEWDDDPEQESDDRRWNGQRWPQVSTDGSGVGGRGDQPRVNPYAMVALAAALVVLFPIAIVFGLLAFGHPRGRGIAVLALLLGISEAAVAVAIGLAVFGGFDVSVPTLAQSVAATPTPVSVTSQGAPPVTEVAPVTEATPVTSPPEKGSVVEKGTECSADKAGLLGVAADGATLLCLRGPSGHTWSGPFRVSGSYYTAGAKCDPSVDKSGRTSDNHALVCEGKGSAAVWSLWTSE
ncbi:hypothetical protein ACFWPX_17950 [Nocardia sp. NPDC058518]|uniref:hypothetical protein n=1 Tax=Nocardia sp. NPDC058518 TaxID=3346534 RepID=UPI00364ED798